MQAWRPRPDLALPQSHRITSANMYVEEQRPLPGSQALEPNLCLWTMCRCVGRMSKYISRAHTDIHSLHAVFAIAPPDACARPTPTSATWAQGPLGAQDRWLSRWPGSERISASPPFRTSCATYPRAGRNRQGVLNSAG